jgi:hypothetical protein
VSQLGMGCLDYGPENLLFSSIYFFDGHTE